MPGCPRFRRRSALLALGTVLLGTSVASAQDAALLRGPPRPLFESDSVLALTLRTDLSTLVRDRDPLTRAEHPGTLSFRDASGAERVVEVEMRTRGHWRLRTCGFPPLRVKFGAGVEGSVFAGEEKLKLVTPCERQGERYEQFILQEYLLYRIYRLFTPYSFRVRLARITYEDTRGRMPAFTRHSFFLESEDGLAERNGGYIMDVDSVRRQRPRLQVQETALLALFQFLIANTDWSIANQHNVRLLDAGAGAAYPIPYDFDWSGVIDTPYAGPREGLPIRSVRERFYQGLCASPEELQPVLAQFREQRSAIDSLLHAVPALAPQRVRGMEKFFDGFFRLIASPRALAREIERGCIGHTPAP